MTDQPKRNQVSPEDSVLEDQVTTEQVTSDGKTVEVAKTEFRHGVLGCCRLLTVSTNL